MFKVVIDDISLHGKVPLIVTCFKPDLYNIISGGKSYFFGKMYKGNDGGIRVNKIIRCHEEMYAVTIDRENEGRQLMCPEISILEAVQQKRRNATITAFVNEVEN